MGGGCGSKPQYPGEHPKILCKGGNHPKRYADHHIITCSRAWSAGIPTSRQAQTSIRANAAKARLIFFFLAVGGLGFMSRGVSFWEGSAVHIRILCYISCLIDSIWSTASEYLATIDSLILWTVLCTYSWGPGCLNWGPTALVWHRPAPELPKTSCSIRWIWVILWK